MKVVNPLALYQHRTYGSTLTGESFSSRRLSVEHCGVVQGTGLKNVAPRSRIPSKIVFKYQLIRKLVGRAQARGFFINVTFLCKEIMLKQKCMVLSISSLLTTRAEPSFERRVFQKYLGLFNDILVSVINKWPLCGSRVQ